MQDNYIGDIGDYGKYGLLREVCAAAISMSVNWYRVVPTKLGKQDDGKYISYLSMPQIYRGYDPTLFDSLHKIVMQEQNRRIERIEQENLFPALYFSEPLRSDRKAWHTQALAQTQNAIFPIMSSAECKQSCLRTSTPCLKSSGYIPESSPTPIFFGWILGFGKKAKLLYPDDVVDQFRAYMDKIREMY